jgi:hypothetical protein
MKPRSMLSQGQLLLLDVLKDTLPGFRLMRRLSLQFRALLRSHTPKGLPPCMAAPAANSYRPECCRCTNSDAEPLIEKLTPHT